MADADSGELRFDVGVPHSARVWNYWLGGKDNFEADRRVGDAIFAQYPDIGEIAIASRGFLRRSIEFLVREEGTKQFLDIGTGLPTANNTHEVAQRLRPSARIVYVDNDPIVLAHARALLTSHPDGHTQYIDADLRTDRKRLLSEAAQTLDFDSPIAVMLLGILGYIEDYDEARVVIGDLMSAVRPGSFLVINDGVAVDEMAVEANSAAQGGGLPYHLRTHDQFLGYFGGLELVEPGVISTPLWRPEAEAKPLANFCGVARRTS